MVGAERERMKNTQGRAWIREVHPLWVRPSPKVIGLRYRSSVPVEENASLDAAATPREPP